jgi:hypothetical protein
MARFSGVKCDGCGSLHEADPTADLPEGWFTITIHSSSEADVVLCKVDCLNRWGKNRKAADKPGESAAA